jgi:hypothetical protein
MPTITGITTKEISREKLCEGVTQKVECKNFWDSHGKRVEYAPTQHQFDHQKKFEIWKVIGETSYSSIDFVHQWEYWNIYIDGRLLEVGEIVGYRILKTKVKLDCCIGAG